MQSFFRRPTLLKNLNWSRAEDAYGSGNGSPGGYAIHLTWFPRV